MAADTTAATNADAPKARVFISYSRKDIAFADRLEAALKARGFEPLIDRTEIYAFEDWWKRIEALIARADTVVFVLSPDAVTSDVALKEVAHAASLNKRFAPIVCRRVDPGTVPEALQRLNFIFFDNPDRFEASADEVSEALQTDIDWIRQHTEYGEAALRWDAAGKPNSQLLRGRDIDDAERWTASQPKLAPQPTALQREYLGASRRAATRRQRTWVAGSVAVAVVAASLAAVAYLQRQQAVAQRDRVLVTQSRFLADLSRQQTAGGDALTGALLAIEGLRDSNGTEPTQRERPYVAIAEQRLFDALAPPREGILMAGHEKWVGHVAVSPDGNLILSSSGDDTARLWRAATGESVAVLHGSGTGASDELSPATVLVEGTRDASGSFSGITRATTIYGHGSGAAAVFSPHGQRIAMVIPGNAASVVTLAPPYPSIVLRGHQDRVWTAQFSSNGTRVVTASSDKTARLWDAATGAQQGVLEGHTDVVWSASFSPDGKRVVTASLDHSAMLWDAQTAHQIAVLRHVDSVHSAIFSYDGRWIATASADNTARLWDANTGDSKAVLRGHSKPVTSIVFSPNSRLLLTTSDDNTAILWDVDGRRQVASLLGHQDRVWSGTFSKDGTYVATVSHDGSARIWKAPDGEPVALLRGHVGNVDTAAFTPDGRSLITGGDDRTVRSWKFLGGEPPRELRGHTGELHGVGFSRDGQLAVTTSSDKTARIWFVQSGETTVVLRGHNELVNDAAFDPDGRRVATGSSDGTLRIWDVETGAPLLVLGDHQASVQAVAFSMDGRYVAASSDDNLGRVWDAAKGELVSTLRGHESAVSAIAFQPHGRLIATASLDKTARLWDPEKGQELRRLAPDDSMLLGLAFTPDGTRVVTISAGKAIRIFDVETAHQITAFTAKSALLGVSLSANGRRLAVAYYDGSSHLIDLVSGEELGQLSGHGDRARGIAINPDGTQIITGSPDGIARIWKIFPNSQDLVDYAKSIAVRCLTVSQRRQFFLDTEPPGWCVKNGKWPY